jgi:hypothetical protein
LKKQIPISHIGEDNNLAANHPEIVSKIQEMVRADGLLIQ